MSLAPIQDTLSADDSVLVQTAREFAEGELLPLDRSCDEDERSVVACG